MAYDNKGNFVGLRDLNDGIGINKERAVEIIDMAHKDFDEIAVWHGGASLYMWLGKLIENNKFSKRDLAYAVLYAFIVMNELKIREETK